MARVMKSFIVILVLLLALPASGQGLSDRVQIHGFVSQGYMQTTENNFLMKSKDGSFEFLESAVNFYFRLGDKLTGGIQVGAYDFGRDGNNWFNLDWGFLDYHWKDALGIRVGKIRWPIGLFNKSRDFEPARISIFMPQSIYMRAGNDLSLAYQGFGPYGNIPMGALGDLDYELFFGTLSVPNPNGGIVLRYANLFGMYGAMEVAMQLGMAGLLPPGADVTWRVYNTALDSKSMKGGALVWNTPLQGLRLGASYYDTDFNLYSNLAFDVVMQGAVIQTLLGELDIIVEDGPNCVLSAEFALGSLILAGECKNREVSFGGALQKELSYYGQATYRFADWFEMGVYYDTYYPNTEDKEGANQVAMGLPAYLAWHKDICATLRFDFTDNWLLKLEMHKVDGCALLHSLDNPDGMEQNWMLFAAKTSFNF
jgi:hypothetical protein